MAFFYTSTAQLERDVNRISVRVRARAFAEALNTFKLSGLTTIRAISNYAETFEYTPKTRNMIMGDISPASCKSEPTTVDVASGDTMKGFTVKHEIGYEICIMDCKDNNLETLVYEKEVAAATMLLHHLYRKFWFGNPELMQYGLTNHPLSVVEEASAGANGTKWSEKTNNEIMKELRGHLKYMTNPQILVSEKAFEESLGNADTNDGGGACSLRADCVELLLAKQETVNFNGTIRFMEELDNRAEFDNKNIALIYDADSMYMTSSGIIYLDANRNGAKTVFANRMINTGGMHIEYADSVKIITGI